jgi:hypothetical protein
VVVVVDASVDGDGDGDVVERSRSGQPDASLARQTGDLGGVFRPSAQFTDHVAVAVHVNDHVNVNAHVHVASAGAPRSSGQACLFPQETRTLGIL